MNRIGNDQDNEIVELLGKLRDAGPEYPPHLYAARRAALIAALAALPIGGVLAVSLFTKLAHVIKGMSVIDKIILGVEVAAITGVSAYGAAAAYIYRDQLKTLLLGTSSVVSTNTSEPIPTLSTEAPVLPIAEETPLGTPTVTGTVTGTVFVTDTNKPQVVKPAATQPPVQGQATKPGLHLGNTPKPDRSPPPKGP
jgi:hypothetical protein